MEITLCTFQLVIDALGPLLFATRSASYLAQEALFKHSLAMLSALCQGIKLGLLFSMPPRYNFNAP